MRRTAAAVMALAVLTFTSAQAETVPTLENTGCPGEILTADGTPVPFANLLTRIKTDGGALIGERHGVRGHPQTLGCLVQHLAQPTPPTVVLEMLTADQQVALDSYRHAHPELIDGLGAALTWWTTGWPVWPIYQPLFETSWHVRAPILAGDMAKATPTASADALTTTFGTDALTVHASWTVAMKIAHCNLIPDATASDLASRQSTRDIAMTQAVTTARQAGRITLLYAGRAHIWNNRSVGFLMRRGAVNPVRPLPSVALFETATAGVPTDRTKVLTEARGRYDYVWFVGTADRPDACERLRVKGLIPTAGVAGGKP